MPRRRRFLVLSLAAILVGLGVGLWLLWPHTAITHENADRIQPGMTLAEVEAILGGPARDETGGRFWINQLGSTLFLGNSPESQQWVSDECAVAVWFTDGHVAFHRLDFVVPKDETPLDKLRRWLRL